MQEENARWVRNRKEMGIRLEWARVTEVAYFNVECRALSVSAHRIGSRTDRARSWTLTVIAVQNSNATWHDRYA